MKVADSAIFVVCLLDKGHANVLPCHVHSHLGDLEDEYSLIISILIISHGYFTFSKFTLRLAKCYIHCHCNSGAQTGPTSPPGNRVAEPLI